MAESTEPSVSISSSLEQTVTEEEILSPTNESLSKQQKKNRKKREAAKKKKSQITREVYVFIFYIIGDAKKKFQVSQLF